MVKTGKFIALNPFLRQEEKLHAHDPRFHLKYLERARSNQNKVEGRR